MVARIQEKMATAQPPYKESYTYKLTKLTTGSALLRDESVFLEEIENTRKVLGSVEEQLGRSEFSKGVARMIPLNFPIKVQFQRSNSAQQMY